MNPALEFGFNLQKLINHALTYADEIEAGFELLDLKGRKISECCSTLGKNSSKYKRILGELKVIDDIFETHQAKIEGGLWQQYTEKYSRALNTRDIQAYIAARPEVIDILELRLILKHWINRAEALVDGFEKTHWQLNNITKLRVAELQDDEL